MSRGQGVATHSSIPSQPNHLRTEALHLRNHLFVTIVNALAPSYRSEVAKNGIAAVLARADKRKESKHAVSVQSTGAKFVSLAFDARGAMGPSAKGYFKELWKAKIQEARELGKSQWPVIAAMLRWRKRFGVCIMNAAAETQQTRADDASGD